ncbi:hypothetical protein NDU88_003604 [Pleurodeles waltl]|uniref:Uncharacterized protein n=1 Tax=Pleurodeles waltl TaxID=8319 RepID=A0AAV7UYW0_PLEWA|nr:hypothetical protein NDU88_003604 [Pleurodeles waltl]
MALWAPLSPVVELRGKSDGYQRPQATTRKPSPHIMFRQYLTAARAKAMPAATPLLLLVVRSSLGPPDLTART